MAILIRVGWGRQGRRTPIDPSAAWYGVEWDVTVASSALTRIGNPELHAQLPVHNKRRGCTLLDNGKVNYYLDPNNFLKKTNGEDANRDGTDGMVMIEQEGFYYRYETEGNYRRIKISEFPLPGFRYQKKYYRGAYEATVYRPENKLSSVANDTPDYRGGNNNAAWDSDDRSLLGVPASNISRTNFQTYARNRGTGWEMEPWHIYLLEWQLYLVEYANRNCQLPFTSSLTDEGFRQGGLGAGVTNINNAAWNAWKSRYGFVHCGYTDEFGVYTGVKPFELPAGYGSTFTTNVPRWRGIEIPFGHLWKWLNGINILVQSDLVGGKSYAYRADNPANWSDLSNDDYQLIGEMIRTSGYMTDVIFGEGGDLLPSVVGGSSATFWGDYAAISIPSSGVSLRGIVVSGSSIASMDGGFGCFHLSNPPSTASASIGSRLCYLGA